MSDCAPTPKARTTLTSWVSPTGTARETKGESQFTSKCRDATQSEIKILPALAPAKTIETCMTNHYYSFGGELHGQAEGEAIGADLTGEVSRNDRTGGTRCSWPFWGNLEYVWICTHDRWMTSWRHSHQYHLDGTLTPAPGPWSSARPGQTLTLTTQVLQKTEMNQNGNYLSWTWKYRW